MAGWPVVGAFGRWSVVGWSVGRWSVVGGRLIGGFKETLWRVITCSPLTLRQCFINTLHVYFPSSQKHYQTPVHHVAYGHSFLLYI